MSRSIHITNAAFRKLSKEDLQHQASDPNSDLTCWAKKSTLKKEKRLKRREMKCKNLHKGDFSLV